MSKQIIYDFNRGITSSLLEQVIEERFKLKSRFEIKIVNLSLNSSNIFLKDRQFFCKVDGEIFRLRYYLKRYRRKWYGKSPSIHIVECETRKTYTSFSATNDYLNYFVDTDTNKRYEKQKLDVCKNCIRELNRELGTRLWGKDWNELILEFEENDETKISEKRQDGYVLNWSQISDAFRNYKNFTCEKCNLKITEPGHKHFMQSHHKNYDKLNNTRDNLQCLCILCHSQVDEIHRRNFAAVDNQQLLNDFMKHYRNQHIE